MKKNFAFLLFCRLIFIRDENWYKRKGKEEEKGERGGGGGGGEERVGRGEEEKNV